MNLRASSLLFTIAVSACSSFGGSADGSSDRGSSGGVGADGGSAAPVIGVPAGGVRIAPLTDRAFVVQGLALDIPIHIVRAPDGSDEVSFAFAAPEGVTITANNISANATDGIVHVQASEKSTQGSVDVAITVTTTTNRVSTTGALPLYVRGAPGVLDTTFAPDALAVTVPATGAFDATLTELADGTMIVAGAVGSTSGRLVKVDTQGKNIASTNLGTGSRVAPLADGRLLNFNSTTIERFSAMLVLDSTLGPGGAKEVTVGSVLLDVAVFDGKTLVLTKSPNLSGSGDFDSFDVTRYTPDAVADSTFAVCRAACAPGSSMRVGAHPLALDASGQARAFVGCGYPDENVIFGCGPNGGRNLGADEPAGLSSSDGESYPSVSSDPAGGYFMAEYLDDPPSPDLTYQTELVHVNSAGAVVGAPILSDLFGVRPAVAVQSDGSVLLANGAGPDRLLAVRRFKPDGTEDTTFVHADPGAGVKTPYGMVIQSDGRIVVLTSSGGALMLVRYWG